MIAYWERDSEWMGDGLVGAWCPSFTGATGLQLADISGQANHGVLTNMDPGTDWVPSGSGLALDFDGVNDVVNIGNKTSLKTPNVLTVSGWINLSTTNNFGMLAGNVKESGTATPSRGYELRVNNDNTVSFLFGNGSDSYIFAKTTDTLVANRWYFLTGVKTSNGVITYIDSNQKASNSTTDAIVFDADNFYIGARNIFFNQFKLDDIRIYNRVLTPSEIQLLYTGGRGAGMLREPPRRRSFQGVTIPRPSSNPVRRKPRKNNTLLSGLVGAWCPSLGANGTRLLDVSGRNNHGVLTNMDANSDYIPSGGKLALDFDGVNDYVNVKIPTIELSTEGCTLSFWYRNATGTTGVYAALCSSTSGTQFLIFQASGSAINLAQRNNAGGDTNTSGGTWQSASWKNIVAVSTPSSLTLFSNGVQTATLSRTSGATTFNQISIGALNRAGSLSNYSVSQQDDIRIYNRALTATEVRQLYQGGRGYGLKQQRIKVGYTDPSPNLNKIRKPRTKKTLVTGLVGAWCPSLGPTGTRLRDVSGRNNDGVLTNMDPNTDWVTSGGKGALDFDGVNDYVAASNAGPIGTNIATSRCAWVFQRTRTNNVEATIIQQQKGANEGFLLMLATFGGITYLFTDEVNGQNNITISGSEIPILNSWNHLLFQVTPSRQWSYFLNGNLIKTGSFAADIVLENKTIDIGRRTTPAGYFDGRIDDIRIYNRALTPQEINQLYVGGRGYGLTPAKRTTSKKTIYVDAPVPAKPKPAVDTSKLKQGLVGAWIPSLGPTGLRLEDKSPYKNHGTLTNMDPNTDWVTSGGLGALDFDGVNDYTISNSPSLAYPFSVAHWLQTSNMQNTYSVHIGNEGSDQDRFIHGYVFNGSQWVANGRIFVGGQVLSFEFGQLGSTFPTTFMHQVIVWRSNTNREIFINGRSVGVNTTNVTQFPALSKVFVGGYPSEGRRVKGVIDDVRIYNRALTAQEIRALYLGGRGFGFRPQRNNRYILGTETINTGGFKGAWYRRRPLMLGSGIQ